MANNFNILDSPLIQSTSYGGLGFNTTTFAKTDVTAAGSMTLYCDWVPVSAGATVVAATP